MSLVPLLPIFHEFNRKYFQSSLAHKGQPIVQLRWSDGRLKSTAGFYRKKTYGINRKQFCEIVLSKPVLMLLPLHAVESTLCHEMIHAWVDLVLKVREGHGPNFYARMKEINSLQDRFEVTVKHCFPIPKKLPKWWGVCPSCGLRFPYKRIVRGAACRSCCDIHFDGQWNANYLLNYESVLIEK